MSSLSASNNPILPLNEQELGIPGLSYGEFDFASLADENAPFKASLFCVAKDAKTPVDEHEVRECWHIISGSGVLSYNGEEHTVCAPQLLFFESHHPHSIHNTGNEELKVLSLWWPRENIA